MAYTPTIEKVEVTKSGVNLYYRVRCTINDGTENVFVKEYIVKRNPSNPLNLDPIREDFMADWDEYVATKEQLDSAAFDSEVAALQSQASTYIN